MTLLITILWAIWSRVKLIGYFVFDNWKVTLPAILILVGVFMFYRNCGHKPAKLDEAAIQAATEAIQKREDAKLKEILAQADVKEKAIDANLANASTERLNALTDARKKYENLSLDELAAEIERRKNQ